MKMKVKIKAIKKHGKSNCPRSHKVGDEFIIEDGKTPGGLCCSAFNSIWPFARALLITKDKKHECSIICPDGIMEYKLELMN